MLDMTASFGGWEGGITAVSRPIYTEKNGCLYVDFGQTSEGTAAREAAMPGTDMPVTAFMREWLRMMETQVRHNTMDCYRYMFRRHIQPFFDSRRLTFRNVAVSDFQAFVDTKYQEGYSPTSILKFHTVIHKCMKYAVIQGLLEHNLSGYVILPKRKRYIGRTFNLEQLGRFLEEARSSPAEPAFMLAAAYGLRRSEAAGLAVAVRGFQQWMHHDQPHRDLQQREGDLQRPGKDGFQLPHAAADGQHAGISAAAEEGTARDAAVLWPGLLPERLCVLPGGWETAAAGLYLAGVCKGLQARRPAAYPSA